MGKLPIRSFTLHSNSLSLEGVVTRSCKGTRSKDTFVHIEMNTVGTSINNLWYFIRHMLKHPQLNVSWFFCS